MTNRDAILAASSGRTHMGILMDFFNRHERWEAYFRACCLFHAYDELLWELQNGRKK